jgi:hypothetical protein
MDAHTGMTSCDGEGGHLMLSHRGSDPTNPEQSGCGDESSNPGMRGKSMLPDPTRVCATERERTRMHMLNDAFDELRKVGTRFTSFRTYVYD